MATLRTDGFVGVQGPVTEGLVTTIPLNVTGPNLYITVDVEPAGSMAPRILEGRSVSITVDPLCLDLASQSPKGSDR